MAEKKASAKSPSAPAAVKPKVKSTASAKPKADADAPSSKAKAARAPAVVSARGMCTSANCKRPLRAKGYCRKHFLAWRRGKLGAHHQYKICSKEACRKPRQFGGLCAEHAGKGEAGAAPPAAAS